MNSAIAFASRSEPVQRSSRTRSAVSNGRRLHVVPPGDTKWARRFRDVLGEIIADLGGADQLSEGQRQLSRRAATICLECERLEAKAVAGEAIDLEIYGQLTDRLGRAFGRLGLKRVARDVTPTLGEYLAAKAAAEPQDAADDEPDSEPAAEGRRTSDSPRASAEPSP